MKNKKLDWLRVGIFIVFSYALAWLPWKLLISKYSLEEFTTSPKFGLLALLLMFPPALAHLITRAVTKEKWQGMYLHLNLKGNMKYYLLSVVYVFAEWGLGGVVLAISAGEDFSISRIGEMTDLKMLPAALMLIIPMQLLMSYYTFGEEFGWRAYLYPKLEKLLNNAPLAGILGGIVWGLWHMPLTNSGYNFGTEYWGFPWMGNVIMCIDCISMGMVMMWFTRKTKSIYPACIIHAVSNNGGSMLMGVIASGIKGSETMQLGVKEHLLIQIPDAAIAIFCAVLMIIEAKKSKQTEKTE